MHKIICIVVGKEGTVKENQSFDEICSWLKENKVNLFGYCIMRGIESWDADFFYRYETDLTM